MRSRYCAYALGLSEYIIKTTHPLNNDYKNDTVLWEKEISQFSADFEFEKLTIIDSHDEEDYSFVTFNVKLNINGKDNSFTEKSKFEKIDKIWLYLSGIQL
jgi:SEC-C motif-containing protein